MMHVNRRRELQAKQNEASDRRQEALKNAKINKAKAGGCGCKGKKK